MPDISFIADVVVSIIATGGAVTAWSLHRANRHLQDRVSSLAGRHEYLSLRDPRLLAARWPELPPSLVQDFRATGWVSRSEEIASEELDRALRDSRIEITPAARTMLLLPFAEHELTGDELPALRETFVTVLRSMREDPDERDAGRFRTSFSVIRSWWTNFCNIPPFCRPTREPHAR